MSEVPPPVASTLFYHGHQSIAFIPALCSFKTYLGESLPISQRQTILSFPPEASVFPSGDHFNPQTSWVCCSRVHTNGLATLTSKLLILESLPPLDKINLFQLRLATRYSWAFISLIYCCDPVSQSCIFPLESPIARQFPF